MGTWRGWLTGGCQGAGMEAVAGEPRALLLVGGKARVHSDGAVDADVVERVGDATAGGGGASPIAVRNASGCMHGTVWFVQQLGARLVTQLVTEPAQALADTLAQAIAHVAALHAGDCDLDHPGTPSASVALLREQPEIVDYLVLEGV